MISPAARERFQSAPWLTELDPTARLALLNVLEEHRVPPGTELLVQGQPNDRIIFQLAGTSIATRQYDSPREELRAPLESPCVYGEISFFRPTPGLATVRAVTPVWFLTLDRPGYDALRRADPRTAEQLARAILRVLAERFEVLDRRVTDFLAEHENHHPRASEWNDFRARLFEESNI
jgi:CRP-like cAMP-binding protein